MQAESPSMVTAPETISTEPVDAPDAESNGVPGFNEVSRWPRWAGRLRFVSAARSDD
jgi:hypothetical protein